MKKYEIRTEYFNGATLVDTSKEYIPETEWDFFDTNEAIEEAEKGIADLEGAANITNQTDKTHWAITIINPEGKEVFYKNSEA